MVKLQQVLPATHGLDLTYSLMTYLLVSTHYPVGMPDNFAAQKLRIKLQRMFSIQISHREREVMKEAQEKHQAFWFYLNNIL